MPEDKSKAVEIWKSILEEVTETKNNIKHKVCHTLYECYNNGLEVAKDEEKANELLLLISRDFISGDPLRYRKNLEKVIVFFQRASA